MIEIEVRALYENNLAVPVRLAYDPKLAAIVTVTFLNSDKEVSWEISRELFATGLFGESGTMDVKIFPVEDKIALRLSPPSGRATIFFDREAIETFVAATFKEVPLGHEFDGLDWDTLLQE